MSDIKFDLTSTGDPASVEISNETMDSKVECPAGAAYSDQASYPACVCRLDGSTVSSKTSPNNYNWWCSKAADAPGGGYQSCPAWRMKRERELREQGLKQELKQY